MQPIKASVKWFAGSFGFLEGEDGRDYFVHYTAIESDERTERREGRLYRKLVELQDVEILAWEKNGEKGFRATRVRKL